MLTTPVNLGDRSYNVLTGSGLLATSGSHARAIFPDAKRCALITDANVGPLYAATVADSLRAAQIDPTIITVPAGEPSKSFACLESVCRSMVSAGLDRKSFAIALGGGVIGDLAGFAASIFFRGIPFLQIPTTIVSVVDSSVGGKTGINTPEGKNLIGSFHQPRLVLIDPATLLSLPDREYHEGFAEVIKHAAIRAALNLSEEFAGLPHATSLRLLRLLHSFHLPLSLPDSIATDAVLAKLARDKKFDHGHMKFVLLKDAGHAFVSPHIPPHAATHAINSLRTPPEL
jgi:3-dehydroquinate synthetase